LPRSPLIAQATKELSKYFAATTDSAFIDRTWQIKQSADAARKTLATGTTDEKLKANASIANRSVEYVEGTTRSDRIADLINGAVSIGSFLNVDGIGFTNGSIKDYEDQISFYTMSGYAPQLMKSVSDVNWSPDGKLPNLDFDKDATDPRTPFPKSNLYAAVIRNPYLGPMTRDVGPLEIFMNGIPTLEFSKCVPYLSINVVSLLRTAGTVAPPLTLIGFLNPPALGASDAAILNAQGTIVRTEASTLGGGLVSGMELFTAPQTLVNMGATGAEFVPVIDRMRPLASLGNLSLSTKMQANIPFTTGRLEITIHDRSRLREMAAFVRPDLYGTTFLDITHGWSHPEGGPTSRNSYGKFLDAMRHTTRFRIAGSTYSFEEGGQMKVTLNIQTVGSTDLLYLGPKEMTPAAREFYAVVRRLNEALAARRSSNTAPSMADYDFLAAFQDPASALAASRDKNILAKARKLLEKLPNDDVIEGIILEMVGNVGKDAEAAAEGSKTDKFQDELSKQYETIINNIPTYDKDPAMGTLSVERFNAMNDNTLYAISGSTVSEAIDGTTTGNKSSVINRTKTTPANFVSYGSVFMNMIAKPLRDSGQYDEVQVIFYPFNKYAGAVHDQPISAFPIEISRLKTGMDELARRSPNVSCRQIIGLLYDRFTHFAPARAYLMAGFYDQDKANKGDVSQYDPKVVKNVKFKQADGKIVPKNIAPSTQLTFEKRLLKVGIPEARFQMPVVQVAVEGAPLTYADGAPILDERGNPRSIVKIHVYDSAMDPHSTLSDIVRAAKDNELSIITLPIAKVNAAQRSNPLGSPDTGSPEMAKVKEVIEAGEKAGVLQAVSIDDLKPVSGVTKDALESMKGNNFYRVKGSYDEVKRLVTAGIPTITYGSSLTAITNASLASNTSPGLGNVQLLRAFAEPGETRAESLTSGVPMQVIPAQLSISTIGCTLFSTMQRMFIDFGTGTSIDNVYHVISFDSTIGKDGFKTEVKLQFADSFAAYRSLNQNLALLALNMKSDTSKPPAARPTFSSIPTPAVSLNSSVPDIDPNRIIEGIRKEIRQALVAAAMPLAQLEANEKAKLEKKLQDALSKVNAKVEAEKQKAIAKVEAAIPEEVKEKVADAQRKITAAALEIQQKTEPVIRAALLAKSIADIILLAETLPAGIGAVVIAEVLVAVDEARQQAAANAKVQ